MKTVHKKAYVLLIPLLGISLFCLLYIVAASLYPGGSEANQIAKGFSWMHNYWCDLLESRARNGTANPAQPIALAAWLVLSLSLVLFWLFLPRLFGTTTIKHRIIQYAGVISSFLGFFIITKHHDDVITASASFGAIALITTMLALKEGRYYELFRLMALCFLIALINYILFATEVLSGSLPVFQKMAFVVCLLTFGFIDFKIYRNASQSGNPDQPPPCS